MNAQEFAADIDKVADNVECVVRGKHDRVRLALTCLFAGGHLLVEDRPGVGKTLLAKAVAASLDVRMNRIQFTPDLQPTDVTGTTVYDQSATGADDRFPFHRGPVFANIVLADEINRASPRTQSALLEVMEEHQVSFDGQTYPLPDEDRSGPFFVVATQNPLDAAGTYPLPDAQLDRFLMRISMGYPDKHDERQILHDDAAGAGPADLRAVLNGRQVRAMTAWARHGVTVDDVVYDYALDVVRTTRELATLTTLPRRWAGTSIMSTATAGPWLRVGASPRAAVALMRSARVAAASRGGTYVEPSDVQQVAVAVLGHRLQPAPSLQMAGVTGEDVIRDVLDTVAVPGVTGRPGQPT